MAVQKTLNKLQESDVKTGGASTHNDDEWGEPTAKKKTVAKE